MKVNFILDHVVIWVNDLSIAINNFTNLGFTVVPGGEHKGLQTHNALIAFSDDSYLELIAFKDRASVQPHNTSNNHNNQGMMDTGYSPVEKRVLHWADTGEGLVDFALFPNAIEAVLDAAHHRGLCIEGPFPGNRMRPDGQLVSWQLGIPDTIDLPFLCADITPRSLRVPGDTDREHPNGATGIKDIIIAVNDLDVSVQRYRALLGIEPNKASISYLPETRASDFAVGASTITLAAPTGINSVLHKRLTARGVGPYAITLYTSIKTRAGILEPSLTHGATIRLEAEPGEK